MLVARREQGAEPQTAIGWGGNELRGVVDSGAEHSADIELTSWASSIVSCS
jgi:hypothetical protein